MKVRRVVAIVVVVALLGGGAVAWKKRQAASVAPAQAAATPTAAALRVLELAPVDLGEVTRGMLERSIPLSGTLRPFEQTVVKTRVSGELREISVREGESVKRGQVIARIDDVELAARAAERRAQVEAARAQVALFTKTRKMNADLLAQNFISQNAFDNVANSLEVGNANLKAAEAQLAVARKALADATVTAPMNAVVSERHAQPGEKLPIDAKLVSLVDLSRVELEADVPGAEIGAVRVGMPVTFTVEGIGDRRFEGRVGRINPTADERSRTIRVYVVLDNADGALRGGMFAKGRLRVDALADAVLVPITALREEAGQPVVWSIESGRIVRHALVIGERDPVRGVVAVKDGVAPGATVLVGGAGNVKPGDQVSVVATARAADAASAPATRP